MGSTKQSMNKPATRASWKASSQPQVEFGDFQTPDALAIDCCRLLNSRFFHRHSPQSIVEPTCGQGRFLAAAIDAFPDVQSFGFELNSSYARAARQRVGDLAKIQQADFFNHDWHAFFARLPEPILVIGNPPWVSNTVLSKLGSSNRPAKSNVHGVSGIEAITGKSNFDISEAMLLRLIEALQGKHAIMALLCKSATARKVLQHQWSRGASDQVLHEADFYRINSKRSFDATVDAGFLVAITTQHRGNECRVFDSLDAKIPDATFGSCDGTLIANMEAFQTHRDCLTKPVTETSYRWRSGIKHDCSKVIELTESEGCLFNGWGNEVDVEPAVLYPMLKSSQVAKGQVSKPKRWMIVTQEFVGQDTSHLQTTAPKAWAYLSEHAERLNGRASSIYRGRPPFSIFGVGSYTFARAKVAVSSLYKNIQFAAVGTYRGKPIVLDDTCYGLACSSRREANQIAMALNSTIAREMLSAFVFKDAKRPITCGILQRIDLDKLVSKMQANC